MNRIRLVWSRIWSILSDFFVSVGLSENLSVAIFVMDSLRQLSMKFLEREELANYNFQNEFLRPFVIVMQKSSSAEIRELIVRCISQMVLSRVSNVKSGWKSVFKVYSIILAATYMIDLMLRGKTLDPKYYAKSFLCLCIFFFKACSGGRHVLLSDQSSFRFSQLQQLMKERTLWCWPSRQWKKSSESIFHISQRRRQQLLLIVLDVL